MFGLKVVFTNFKFWIAVARYSWIGREINLKNIAGNYIF